VTSLLQPTWPDRLLSLDDWDALPEDTSHRFELVEGVLQVVPRPTSFHQRAVTRLATLLDDALPDHLTALAEVEVVVKFGAGEGRSDPATVRVPDVVVVPAAVADTNPARYLAGDVLVAVEVLSTGTVRTDQVTKFAEYADAGIQGYWIVDVRAGVSITAYALVAKAYELVARTEGRLDVMAPVELSLDVSGLLRRRR